MKLRPNLANCSSETPQPAADRAAVLPYLAAPRRQLATCSLMTLFFMTRRSGPMPSGYARSVRIIARVTTPIRSLSANHVLRNKPNRKADKTFAASRPLYKEFRGVRNIRSSLCFSANYLAICTMQCSVRTTQYVLASEHFHNIGSTCR